MLNHHGSLEHVLQVIEPPGSRRILNWPIIVGVFISNQERQDGIDMLWYACSSDDAQMISDVCPVFFERYNTVQKFGERVVVVADAPSKVEGIQSNSSDEPKCKWIWPLKFGV